MPDISDLNPRCAICGSHFLRHFSEKTIRCPRCETPFHEFCWNYNNQSCAMFGCIGAPNQTGTTEAIDSADIAMAAIVSLSRYLRRAKIGWQVRRMKNLVGCYLPLVITLLCVLSPMSVLFLVR